MSSIGNILAPASTVAAGSRQAAQSAPGSAAGAANANANATSATVGQAQ